MECGLKEHLILTVRFRAGQDDRGRRGQGVQHLKHAIASGRAALVVVPDRDHELHRQRLDRVEVKPWRLIRFGEVARHGFTRDAVRR